MHELAVAQSALSIVLKEAEKRKAGKITRILLTVGKLSGVVPDSLKFCLEAISKGTAAENAELVIEEKAARGYCPECGTEIEAGPFDFVCPSCRGFLHTEGGRELFVNEMEAE